MIPVVIGLVCLALGGVVALWRAPSEFSEKGRISPITVAAVFIAFIGSILSTFVAAWYGYWPVEIPNGVAIAVGGIATAIGAAIYLTARIQFRSYRLAWGLSSDRLVTTGIYRYSRNPQLVGWALILLGVALINKSGAALLLATMFCVSCLIYVPVEERFMERRHGAGYREYKRTVPRYLGFPRDGGQ